MSATYEERWARFWPRRNWYRALIYGASLPLLALLLVMDRYPSLRSVIAVLLAAYFGLMIYWRWKLLSWPCPVCHHPFYNRWGAAIPFSRHCSHCGAPFPRSSGPA